VTGVSRVLSKTRKLLPDASRLVGTDPTPAEFPWLADFTTLSIWWESANADPDLALVGIVQSDRAETETPHSVKAGAPRLSHGPDDELVAGSAG
jgi:hypothetical protein